MTTLLIFQIAGALLSSAATIHKIVKGNTDKSSTTANVAKRGRLRAIVDQLDLIFIVCGMLTTIVALVFQSNKTEAASIRAQNQASNQLELINVTLTGVYRIVTRFDEMSFTVTYELPQSNCFVPIFRELYKSSPALSAPNIPKTAGIIVGYQNIGTNTMIVQMSSTNTELSLSLPSDNYVLTNLYSKNSDELRKAIDFFCTPILSLNLDSQKHPGEHLNVQGTNLLRSATLIYHSDSHKVSIKWTFDCPQICRDQTKRMSSLPDLAHAKMRHYVLGGVPKELKTMKAVDAELLFDNNSVHVGKFFALPPSYFQHLQGLNLQSSTNSARLTEDFATYSRDESSDGRQFFSDLPDQTEILNGL